MPLKMRNVRLRGKTWSTVGTKTCTTCNKTFPDTEEFFAKRPEAKVGVRAQCRACFNKKSLESYHGNLEKARLSRRRYALKAKYGVDEAWYDLTLRAQGGVCAICGEPETTSNQYSLRKLCIDHDHKTGKVRGLLCSRCNAVLGRLKDDGKLILKMFYYLKNGSL